MPLEPIVREQHPLPCYLSKYSELVLISFTDSLPLNDYAALKVAKCAVILAGREANISKPPAEWLRTMEALCRFLRWSPPERIVFDYRSSDEFFNRHKGRSTGFGDRPNPNVKV